MGRTVRARGGTGSNETVDQHGRRTIKLADGITWSVGAVANPVWGMAAPIPTPIGQTRLDGVSSRREVKYGLQPQRGLPYVLAGTLITIINGQSWTQNFDPARRTATLLDPAGRRTILSYDESGRILSYSAPGSAPLSYTYKADGREVSKTIGTAKSAATTHYAYDANAGEIKITGPDGTVEKTEVDKSGRPVSASAGDGSTVIAGYDAAGRLKQLQPPGGLNFTLGTSPGGRATAFAPPMVNGDSSIETSSYDADGQLTTISGLGSRAVNLAYNSAGRVTSWTFDQGKRTAFYDPHSGLMTQATDSDGVDTSYGYAGSLPTRLTWSGRVNGSVSVALDANGRAIAEAVNGANTLDFKYDPAGNLSRIGPLFLNRDAASGPVTHTALGVL